MRILPFTCSRSRSRALPRLLCVFIFFFSNLAQQQQQVVYIKTVYCSSLIEQSAVSWLLHSLTFAFCLVHITKIHIHTSIFTYIIHTYSQIYICAYFHICIHIYICKYMLWNVHSGESLSLLIYHALLLTLGKNSLRTSYQQK